MKLYYPHPQGPLSGSGISLDLSYLRGDFHRQNPDSYAIYRRSLSTGELQTGVVQLFLDQRKVLSNET